MWLSPNYANFSLPSMQAVGTDISPTTHVCVFGGGGAAEQRIGELGMLRACVFAHALIHLLDRVE